MWEMLLSVVIVTLVGLATVHVVAGDPPKTYGKLCIANIKIDGTALQMYAADFDDRLPPDRAWMDALVPYVPNRARFHCPKISEAGGVGSYGYAFNSDASSKRLLDLEFQTPLIFDSNVLGKNAVASPRLLPNPPRHEKGNVVGYADGSVGLVSKP